MIKSFMIGYLERHGYIVLKNRVPMLVVSGNATASHNKDKTEWVVSFSVIPYIVALNHSVVQ